MEHFLYFSLGLLTGIIIALCFSYVYIKRRMSSIQKKAIKKNSELQHQQQAAIKDLEDTTKNLKNRLDMETTIKAFNASHPTFEKALRSMSDTKLSKRDIYLAILIHQGSRIPEIAQVLGISYTSVEVARHRLRTKLGIDKGDNMAEVLRSL